MPAPATCVITAPANNYTVDAKPGGTALITVTVTTDATTPVQLKFGVTNHGAPVTSNGAGLATFTNVAFPIGTTVLTAVAGTDPDFTTSTAKNVIVTNQIALIAAGSDRSVAWYLNWLAGNSISGSLMTAKDAACLWAGVSNVDYGLIGALNVKASNTDRSRWMSVNATLNQIKYGHSGPWLPSDTDVVWLSSQNALLAIALAAV